MPQPHLKTVYIDATMTAILLTTSIKPCGLCGTRKDSERIEYELWLNRLNYDTKWLCLNCSDKIEGARNRGQEPLGGFYD